MSDWKKYTGSDEQIAEMRETINGFILRDSTGVQTEMFKRIGSSYIGEYIDSRRRLLSGNNLKEVLTKHKITNYLICNPHPYADMICQWARTGQPVWVRQLIRNYTFPECFNNRYDVVVTNTPDWDIPGAEYSLTTFEE